MPILRREYLKRYENNISIELEQRQVLPRRQQ